jgi:phosphoribosylformylglycinamidine synthase
MDDARICILRIEGTNCETETYLAFKRLNARPEIVHLKQLTGDVRESERRDLFDYHALIIPGGFSSGDYIRAGAVFGARMKHKLGRALKEFVEDDRPVGGICNGFQDLVEMGILPGTKETMSEFPIAALAMNDSTRFECRPTLLKHENVCAFTRRIERKRIVCMPCAHSEGKFSIDKKELQRLIDNEQIIFRYVDKDGKYAGYPWNPNGSIYNIAGISNPCGNVFGMMPHPERAFHSYTYGGDGKAVFESVLGYIYG